MTLSISGRVRFDCALLLFCLLATFNAWAAPTVGADRTQLTSSIKPVAVAATAPSTAELQQPMELMVTLKVRNYSELLGRIAKGEIIRARELSDKYYPLPADYQVLTNWLTSEGFTITKTDPNRLAVFVSAPVFKIQEALQVSFGKVVVGNQTYVSALTAPIVPANLTPALVGINGLQPHIQLHKHSQRVTPRSSRLPAQSGGLRPLTADQPPFLVGEVLKAYNADSLTLTGQGEKIAVVIDTFPAVADLTQFWALNIVPQTLNNIEFVQVVSGTLPAPSEETTLDVEWTSGIASGAKVRVYATQDLSFVHVDQAFQQILTDLPNEPTLHQLSISLGGGESEVPTSQLVADAQYFALIAVQGVSIFVSSGDSGSNEGGSLQVSYFASDPSVTAVGGTSLFLSTCSGNTLSEIAWDGSGGGISTFFSRPDWQLGSSLPPGTTRLVPDVASAADPDTGSVIILNAVQEQIGGTSWSAPVWAGFSALINQARATAGMAPAGLLGPKIYPLLGTTAFRDITTGNNGAYSAQIGYDLTTGLGVPVVATLVQALSVGPTPPQAPPPPPANAIGEIISPDSACPLLSSAVTFTWTPGSSTAYWLLVGSTPGASDIFNSGQTGGHSSAVSNLPTDGRTIFVNLWSMVGGAWSRPPEYQYTTQLGGVVTPVIAPRSGIYKKKVLVNIATATPQAAIYYTTDGSTPTINSPPFKGPFLLKKTTTVRAKAFKTGVPESQVAAATFTITR
ncbi:MAG: kumamolisin [Verrucomicrobiota bacterium]|jgi:kumamolisin